MPQSTESTESTSELDIPVILSCGDTSVCVCPQSGMTVEQITFCGTDLLVCDESRKQSGATYAAPILYPTPNRVENDQFVFNGRAVAAVMHGVVRHAPFVVDGQGADVSHVWLRAHLDFTPGTTLHEAFPYESRLTVMLTVFAQSVRWDYTVENFSDEPLPYSLALHPFWRQYANTRYRVFADYMMEMDTAKLPTGSYLLTAHTPFDLRDWQQADVKPLDHVFCVDGTLLACISHPQQGIGIKMQTGKAFRRCVVYMPCNGEWFCIEPQTSATNCHNLHDKGFVEQANLQIVSSHGSAQDYAEWTFNKI